MVVRYRRSYRFLGGINSITYRLYLDEAEKLHRKGVEVIKKKEEGGKKTMKNRKFLKLVCLALTVVTIAIVCMFGASAEGTSDIAGLTSTIQDSFTTMISNLLTMLFGILPSVLTLVAAGIIISYGISYMKKLTGKSK